MSIGVNTAREYVGRSLAAFKMRVQRGRIYREVYDSPQGRRMIHDLLRKCGVLESAPAEDSRFFEGRRSVALEILNELRWSEGEMIALAEEQTTETVMKIGEPN